MYVLFDPLYKRYVSGVGKWQQEMHLATQFKTKEKANAYIKQNKRFLRGTTVDIVCVEDIVAQKLNENLDSVNEKQTMTSQNENITACATNIPETTFEAKAVENKVQMATATEDDAHTMTEDKAMLYVNQLTEAIARLNSILEVETELNAYYDRLVWECDAETQDFLHKIELTDVNVCEGYRLYKGLQDVRRRRRKAKDAQTLLQLPSTTHLLNAAKTTAPQIAEKLEKRKTRAYYPRLRQDLFDNQMAFSPQINDAVG